MRRSDEQNVERLVARLEAGEEIPREEIAEELRRILAPGRVGRPPSPATVRVVRRIRRAVLSSNLYHGCLPAGLAAGREVQVANARGSWTEADAVAAELLKESSESVSKDRRAMLTKDGKRLHLLPRGRAATTVADWEEIEAELALVGIRLVRSTSRHK